jgi:uncharacterized protein (DUF849 family)
MFSDGFAFGFPPEEYGLEAYLKLLEAGAPEAHWMIAGLAVDVRPLIAAAVARGGHVRVGLEDAPLGTDVRNAMWVDQAAAAIENAGGQVATATEIRRTLAQAGV